jgi:archaellum component FlaC
MRKIILASTLSALVLSTFAILPATPMQAAAAGDRVAATREQLQVRMEARCNLIESRVQLITNRYEANKQRHIDRYQKLKANVTSLVTKLETNNPGYDLGELKSDLNELDELIRKFGGEYNTLIGLLNETKSLACGESEGAYLAKLDEVKAQNLKIRQVILDTRSFVQSDLRPTIQQIREDLK